METMIMRGLVDPLRLLRVLGMTWHDASTNTLQPINGGEGDASRRGASATDTGNELRGMADLRADRAVTPPLTAVASE
jgi:hypothetical protein